MRKKKERQPQRRPMTWTDAAPRVVEELEDENAVDRVRFDCTQNAIRLDAQSDRVLTIIFLTMIVGGVALLLTANLDLWVGAPILLALVCFVIGLGQTVLHAQILGRLALHAEAVAIEDEASAEEYERLQREAVNAVGSLQFLLLLGALLATGGIMARFWPYAWRGAAIGLGLIALIKAINGVRYLAGKIRR